MPKPQFATGDQVIHNNDEAIIRIGPIYPGARIGDTEKIEDFTYLIQYATGHYSLAYEHDLTAAGEWVECPGPHKRIAGRLYRLQKIGGGHVKSGTMP